MTRRPASEVACACARVLRAIAAPRWFERAQRVRSRSRAAQTAAAIATWVGLASLVAIVVAGQPAPVHATARNGTWNKWVYPLPEPREAGVSAVYDAPRDRVLFFGGAGWNQPPTNRLVAWVAGGTEPWKEIVAAGQGAVQRKYHSAIYDASRDRMIVFGGHYDASGNVRLGDVWVLTLSDPMTWTQVTPVGPGPSPRWGHTAVYDERKDRMVVFGGNDATGARNDIWALWLADPMTWTELSTLGTPPPPRYLHAAAVDPQTHTMYVFGGRDSSSVFDDVWSFILGPDVWLPVTTTVSGNPALVSPPSRRFGHAMAFDPVQRGLLIHGGTTSLSPTVAPFNDTYELLLDATTPTWVQRQSNDSGRYATCGAFDTQRNELVVSTGYGSYAFLTGPAAYDVTSDQWRTPNPPGPFWQVGLRRHPAIVHDVARDRLVIFGGTGAGSSDVWAFSLVDGSFSDLTRTPAPQLVAGAAAVYDPLRERMIVFGGKRSNGTTTNQAWAFDLAGATGWTQLAAGASPSPPARAYASAVYDWRRDRMIVFGGVDASTVYDDTWALELGGSTVVWTELAQSGPRPEPRQMHNAVYDDDRDRMLVLQGIDGPIDEPWVTSATASAQRSMWALDCATDTWTLLDPFLPFARADAGAIVDPVGDRLLVFGGMSESNVLVRTLYAWPLSGGTWTLVLPVSSPPSPRRGSATFYDAVRDRMVIYGGYDWVSNGRSWNPVPFEEVWLVKWGSANATAAGDVPPPSAVRAPYPNPFNPETTIPFTLRRPGVVRVSVFDAAGRRVADVTRRRFGAGEHRVRWNGRDRAGRAVASGVYFVRVEGPGVRATRKVVLVK